MKHAPVLKLKNISVTLNGVRIIERLDLNFGRGVTALVGPNGAGKTTIFNLISGLTSPDEGHIYYKGEEITGLPPWEITRRGIGRTFQDMLLFDGLTVLQNVSVVRQTVEERGGLKTRLLGSMFPRRSAAHERQLADEAMAVLKDVGLDGKANEPAERLSYGEQKLLSVARLLVAKPEVLLLDEPVAWVHGEMVDVILRIISEQASRGKTVIVIEHDQRLLDMLGDDSRYYEMAGGRVVRHGSVREVAARPHARAAKAAWRG